MHIHPSPPSRRVCTATCTAGEVLYWDLVEATVVRRFKAHSGVDCSLAMHPEGKLLLTSSVDGTIKAWSWG